MITLPTLLRRAPLARLGCATLFLTGALLLLPYGCAQGTEGDRCNPDLAAGESECNSGLSCQQPADCPESYCCPVEGPSGNPFCQPGCNGGQASICDAGGDADCWELGDGG